MNRLPLERRAQIIGLLAEGNSLRAASRLADVSLNTTTKLMIDVGAACEEFQDRILRNLKSRRIQCDEIWSFVYAKAKNVPEEHKGEWGYGDVWTWVAMDADTKLVPSWAVGRRDGFTAAAFIRDLADRLSTRVQLTTDGHKIYLEAVEGAFGAEIDYAMLVKLYGGGSGKSAPAERRYSPAVCTGSREQTITGKPRPGAYLHQLHRAAEPHDADEHAAVHTADQRPILEEGREPQGDDRPPLHALQLRSDS